MKTQEKKLISFISSLFDKSLLPSEIKDFVVRKFQGLKIKPTDSESDMREFKELRKNLDFLGWIKQSDVIQNESSIHEEAIKLKKIKWFKSLDNGRIINQGIIAKGAGENLDWLDDNNEDMNGFTPNAIESLLKHVEIKRKKVLNSFSQELSDVERFLEVLRISILFSRVSRRHSDLRLLNTAFKINDWYYPFFKTAHSGDLLITFLLALTEQEISALEMLQ